MKKITCSVSIYLLIFALFVAVQLHPAFAQLDTDFGKSLLIDEPEAADLDPAKLTIDAYLSNTYNNHIELGLSVDPYTSSLAGQENPQLSGTINRFGLNLLGALPIGNKLRLNLQYAPQSENYIGEDGKLNEFDAFTDVTLTELRYQPFSDLPPFVVSHQFQRFVRKLNVYNNTERQLGLRFGRVLEYNLRLHRFDDEFQRREDFLLIGSTTHKATTRLQFGLHKHVLGKVEYAIEHGRYQTNLNNLILGVTGLGDDKPRTDWRHFAAAKLLQTTAKRFVFQEEASLFLNRSNADFFNFISVETALSKFYRFDTERWFRLKLFRVWVQFEGRQTRDESGNILEGAENRSDTQLGFNAQVNYRFTPHLTLNADYQFTQNRTNEKDVLLDFLNYNHSIVSLTLRGNY